MKYAVLVFLRFYTTWISPCLSSFFPHPICRFSPSCSEYTYRAVERYGTMKGLVFGFRRLLHCHPFSERS